MKRMFSVVCGTVALLAAVSAPVHAGYWAPGVWSTSPLVPSVTRACSVETSFLFPGYYEWDGDAGTHSANKTWTWVSSGPGDNAPASRTIQLATTYSTGFANLNVPSTDGEASAYTTRQCYGGGVSRYSQGTFMHDQWYQEGPGSQGIVIMGGGLTSSASVYGGNTHVASGITWEFEVGVVVAAGQPGDSPSAAITTMSIDPPVALLDGVD